MTNMPFVKLVSEHRGGDLESACSEKMRAVIDAIREFGGKGELTLKLGFSMTEYGMLEVKADLKAKAPEPKLKSSAFFLTAEGDLVRHDPRQTDIEDMPGVKRLRPAPAAAE